MEFFIQNLRTFPDFCEFFILFWEIEKLDHFYSVISG